MSLISYDPTSQMWTVWSNGISRTTRSRQEAEDWLDAADHQTRPPSRLWQAVTSVVLWVYWTVFLVGMVVVSPIVILDSARTTVRSRLGWQRCHTRSRSKAAAG